ncbi:NAD(+) diphosphatase [Vibrio viridaestus]|uniref:NAD-capped RNA hydrolase NudC n=1 Tax=Vibrio viridaestus TaxID=2487322 RepID=A0A3N9TAQ4_9VIBR|nr:NAD(+) diphosphatase [Vibrio viridaestus]RQW61129.1 NAD(+) diphosphatase [Vibrio viridaestus]
MLKKSDTNDAYWCVVSGSELWTVDGQIPFGSAKQLSLPIEDAIEVGRVNHCPVYWLNESELEGQYEMTSLRYLLEVEESLFFAASKAVQYGHMTQSLRFCPQCGGRNHLNHQELAMQCNDCRSMHYPRIFPCIIVAIRRDNQILLANHARHSSELYTVIAGFVEVGETLEQTVAREVFEETGLKVKNIRYVSSQPWAFPSSMMVGFMADYESGEIRPDYTELSDASWFDVDNMPQLAPVGTIARALIEQTVTDIKRDS